VTPENDSITLPALAADKKATLLQQMQKPTPAKNKIHVQATRATLTAHLQKSVKIAQPKTHVAPDTVKAARDQRQSQAICAAYGNNIPGIPNACK
jgi:methionyl-tRNA formyltransferase